MRMKFILPMVVFCLMLVSNVLADDCSVFDGSVSGIVTLNSSLNCEINDSQSISNAIINCNGATITAGTTQMLNLGDNSRVSGCVLEGIGFAIGSDNVTIENNYWSDEAKIGSWEYISTSGSTDVTIRNNTWHNVTFDNDGALVTAVDQNGLYLYGNIWENSDSGSNSWYYAMEIGGENVEFKNNTFYDLYWDGSDDDAQFVLIRNSTGIIVSGNVFENISIPGVGYHEFYCFSTGSFGGEVNEGFFDSNEFINIGVGVINNSLGAIWLNENSDNLTISNNIFDNFVARIPIIKESGDHDGLLFSGNIWRYSDQANLNSRNIFELTGEGVIVANNTVHNVDWTGDDQGWYGIFKFGGTTKNFEFSGNLFENLSSSVNLIGAKTEGLKDALFINNDFKDNSGFFMEIYIYNSTDNVNITGNRFNGDYVSYASVVWDWGENVTINNNNWTNYTGQAISFAQDSTNGLVDNNRFENIVVGDWEQIIGCGNNKTGFTVTNNYFNNINETNGAIMGFWGVNDVTIDSNEIYNVNVLSNTHEQNQITCWNNCVFTNNKVENITRFEWPASNSWTGLYSVADFSGLHPNNGIISGNNITNVDVVVFSGSEQIGFLYEDNKVVNSGGYDGLGFLGGVLNIAGIKDSIIRNNHFEDSAGAFLGWSNSYYYDVITGNVTFENNHVINIMNSTYSSRTGYRMFDVDSIYEHIVVNNNTFEMTRNCIDYDINVNDEFCEFTRTGVGFGGSTVTNNRVVTNGYNLTYPLTYDMSIYNDGVYEFNSEVDALFENNSGPFTILFWDYGSSSTYLNLTIRNNNLTHEDFEYSAESQSGDDGQGIWIYDLTGIISVNIFLQNNTIDSPDYMFYVRYSGEYGNDWLEVSGNDFDVGDGIIWLWPRDSTQSVNTFNNLSFYDNTHNAEARVTVGASSGKYFSVPDDFELFDECDLGFYGADSHPFAAYIGGFTADFNGHYNLSEVTLTSASPIELYNAGLLTKPVVNVNASNDWQGNGNTAYYISPKSASGDTYTPVESGSVPVYVNFTVNSTENISDMQTYEANLSLVDNYGLNCSAVIVSDNEIEYNCEADFLYYYSPGNYDLNSVVADKYGARSHTFSAPVTYNQLTATQRDRTYVAFTGTFIGLDNVSVDVPVTIENTGNDDITVAELTAYDVEGAVVPSEKLLASYFRAGAALNESTQLEDSVAKNITFTLNAGDSSTLDFYLWVSAPSNLYPQSYVSLTPWQLALS